MTTLSLSAKWLLTRAKALSELGKGIKEALEAVS
jgi:hypothetical protein